MVWNWHKLQPIKVPGCSDIIPPREMETCAGAASVHDLQLSQLSPDEFQPITEPLKLIDFNFSKGDFCEGRTKITGARTVGEGHCHGLFMWWELSMDTEGEVLLSTAPHWAHPDGKKAPWRDHWMQAVYFFDRPMYVKKGKTQVNDEDFILINTKFHIILFFLNILNKRYRTLIRPMYV